MEPHFTSIDDEISKKNIDFMFLSDCYVVKFVKLFIYCFLYFDKIDHQAEWRQDRYDTSSKRKEVSRLFPFIVMGYVLTNHLYTWKPHNVIKQIIHKRAWLPCIKHDFSEQIDLFAYFLLRMRDNLREFVYKFEQSEYLSSFRKTFLYSLHDDHLWGSRVPLFELEISWWFLARHI